MHGLLDAVEFIHNKADCTHPSGGIEEISTRLFPALGDETVEEVWQAMQSTAPGIGGGKAGGSIAVSQPTGTAKLSIGQTRYYPNELHVHLNEQDWYVNKGYRYEVTTDTWVPWWPGYKFQYRFGGPLTLTGTDLPVGRITGILTGKVPYPIDGPIVGPLPGTVPGPITDYRLTGIVTGPVPTMITGITGPVPGTETVTITGRRNDPVRGLVTPPIHLAVVEHVNLPNPIIGTNPGTVQTTFSDTGTNQISNLHQLVIEGGPNPNIVSTMTIPWFGWPQLNRPNLTVATTTNLVLTTSVDFTLGVEPTPIHVNVATVPQSAPPLPSQVTSGSPTHAQDSAPGSSTTASIGLGMDPVRLLLQWFAAGWNAIPSPFDRPRPPG